jgi:hypothetical protein
MEMIQNVAVRERAMLTKRQRRLPGSPRRSDRQRQRSNTGHGFDRRRPEMALARLLVVLRRIKIPVGCRLLTLALTSSACAATPKACYINR